MRAWKEENGLKQVDKGKDPVHLLSSSYCPGGALKILCTQNDLNANGIKIAGDSRYTQN